MPFLFPLGCSECFSLTLLLNCFTVMCLGVISLYLFFYNQYGFKNLGIDAFHHFNFGKVLFKIFVSSLLQGPHLHLFWRFIFLINSDVSYSFFALYSSFSPFSCDLMISWCYSCVHIPLVFIYSFIRFLIYFPWGWYVLLLLFSC